MKKASENFRKIVFCFTLICLMTELFAVNIYAYYQQTLSNTSNVLVSGSYSVDINIAKEKVRSVNLSIFEPEEQVSISEDKVTITVPENETYWLSQDVYIYCSNQIDGNDRHLLDGNWLHKFMQAGNYSETTVFQLPSGLNSFFVEDESGARYEYIAEVSNDVLENKVSARIRVKPGIYLKSYFITISGDEDNNIDYTASYEIGGSASEYVSPFAIITAFEDVPFVVTEEFDVVITTTSIYGIADVEDTADYEITGVNHLEELGTIVEGSYYEVKTENDVLIENTDEDSILTIVSGESGPAYIIDGHDVTEEYDFTLYKGGFYTRTTKPQAQSPLTSATPQPSQDNNTAPQTASVENTEEAEQPNTEVPAEDQPQSTENTTNQEGQSQESGTDDQAENSPGGVENG